MTNLLLIAKLTHDRGELLKAGQEKLTGNLRQVLRSAPEVVEGVVEGIFELGHTAKSTAVAV